MADFRSPPPRRVLHVIDSLGLGGAQVVLKGYFESRAAPPSDHLYALRSVGNAMAIAHPNVAVCPSPARFSLAPLRALRDVIRRQDIDILHCHLFRSQVFGYLAKALYFPKLALIFHEHGRAVGREGESWLEDRLFRLFLAAARRRVDCYVCNSDHTRMKLMEVLGKGRGKATTVANPVRMLAGVPDRKDIDAWRSEAGVPAGAFVVGFAARLTRAKGWRDFLLAMQLLGRRLPAYFLLAGDGEDRGMVEACIRDLGLQAQGRVLGYVNCMDRFYPMLDCFVLPSHWESHGLSHLEAQGHAIPVVVSDVPGLNATVHAERDALLFKAGDPLALADQVARIAADIALRTRLVEAGRANAAAYTMASFAAGLEQVYREALASPMGTT